MKERWELLDRAELDDLNRAIFADTTEIISHQIDDHYVLGTVLLAVLQKRPLFVVREKSVAARYRALDRPCLDTTCGSIELDSQEPLRRRAHPLVVGATNERRERRRMI